MFDGKHNHIVRATKENKILKWLCKYDSPLIMFHHRFPTSTVNVKRAAHPFTTRTFFGDTTYVLVHNGIIRNAEDLFIAHQEQGIDYHTFLEDLTFNDSEALLWDFALWQEGKQEKMQAIGDMAFICIKLKKNKRERVFFYRNFGRPLNMLRSSEGLMLSSEGPGEEIKSDVLYNWNYDVRRLYTKELIVPEYERKIYSFGAPQTTVPYANPVHDYYDADDYPNYSYIPGSYSREAFDDEEAYERWMDNSDLPPKRTMNWLKDVLKDKFTKYFNSDGTPKGTLEPSRPKNWQEGEVLNFERSDGGLYVPVDTRKDHELLYVERKRMSPSDEEISNTMTAYLSTVQGHFEQAHWAIEADYMLLEDKPQTENVIREKVLLDLALQRLDADPEYIDQESVSSEWRTLWAHMELA